MLAASAVSLATLLAACGGGSDGTTVAACTPFADSFGRPVSCADMQALDGANLGFVDGGDGASGAGDGGADGSGADGAPIANMDLQFTDINGNGTYDAAIPQGWARATEVTPTAVNSLTYLLTVHMTSGTYSGLGFTATYIADGSASVQEICEGLVAQINALMPASTVIATEDNTKVILTAEVAGVGFEVDAGSSTTAVVTISTTTANVALSGALSSSFAGVAAWSHVADENYSHIPGALADGLSYPPDAIVNAVQYGPVHVRLSSDMSALTVGDPVYLTFSDTGTGSAGDFRNTADSGYAVLLTGCRWTSAAYADADGGLLAELTIDSLAG
jgi:hypothetical protein